MPPSAKYPSGHRLPLRDRVLVVIGANGSGKSRFGAWLDTQDIKLHHRVSAHRSLVFPERVQPMDMGEAEARLFTGSTEKNNPAHHRQHNRWQNRPATALLDDYDPLLTFLVSESFTVSDRYRVAMKASDAYAAPPSTRIDSIKQIWEAVLPSRELVITGNRFEVQHRSNPKPYHAKEMSDGERGIFYLIGEALSVPANGLFIVDEPELHLHRAIQARLWDAVEAARPDCTFVYITHDLGFAASRRDATRVWLREYTEGRWEWEEVPETDGLPESLLLEVMGSRHPILFVEGTRSSLDYFIYGKLFPAHCVMPCGSCEGVIHATRSFGALATLHHNTCSGLVDYDGRSDEDVALLERLSVGVLEVALVENLLLTEPVLKIAAERLGLAVAETVEKVKARVFELLRQNRVRVISNLVRQEIEGRLRRFGGSGDGKDSLTSGFQEACGGVSPAGIYDRWEQEVTRVLAEADYPAALRYYKSKGLASEAGGVFGLRYPDQILRWLRHRESEQLLEALRGSLPRPTRAAPVSSPSPSST